MSEIRVTGAELLFVAAALGGKSFYGIQDPFWAMDSREIILKQSEAKLSLEKKGYVSLGFDDSVVFESLLEEIVRHCTFCEQYLMLDTIYSGFQQPSTIYYFRHNKAAQLTRGADEEYVLSWIEAHLLFDNVLTRIHKNSVPHRSGSAFTLNTQDMTQLQFQCANGDGTLDFPPDIPTIMREILESGLRKKGDYSVVTLTDINQRSIKHLICIHTQQGSLRLWQDLIDDENAWKIGYTNREELDELLRKLVGQYAIM
jgi:hypothetical protein